MTEKEIQKLDREFNGRLFNWRTGGYIEKLPGFDAGVKYELRISDGKGWLMARLIYAYSGDFADLEYMKKYKLSDLLKGRQATLFEFNSND